MRLTALLAVFLQGCALLDVPQARVLIVPIPADPERPPLVKCGVEFDNLCFQET